MSIVLVGNYSRLALGGNTSSHRKRKRNGQESLEVSLQDKGFLLMAEIFSSKNYLKRVRGQMMGWSL